VQDIDNGSADLMISAGNPLLQDQSSYLESKYRPST
jgi:hypothetical protein